jgi:hypothetical protein
MHTVFPYFVTSLFHLFFVSKNGGALPAAMGAAAKRRAVFRREDRSMQEIQMPGGGGAPVAPLNFCMCIPCLPGPPCVTV